MTWLVTTWLGLSSLLATYLFWQASSDIPLNLSPQGCRMSWMSPSYILQVDFNTSLSPLANRYSLWLYREVDWQPNHPSGVPVLFIPGNAGSSHQVRSIASSAVRQFFDHPGIVARAFADGRVEPLDFFAVEFNEDLSAFHGPTLDSEIRYTSDAISYVLSLYPPNTSIIVMGHSMGGIVAVSLLPSTDISAIITMSTPHTLPPARFDSRIDALYTANMRTLLSDRTPILSLCGGATDMMVPSESCILPRLGLNANAYRRTLFTTALEGAWTGVGHREMVWCHQVRWRVARAALELGAASTEAEQGAVLDVWLKDGHLLPPSAGATPLIFSDADTYETLPRGERLILNQPRRKRMYLLPSPRPGASGSAKFILFVSQGSIGPVAPYTHLVLRISVYRCQERSSGASFRCSSLEPVTLRLIPNPPVGKPFPSPEEGVDESEGVVLYEADIQTVDEHRWVGVYVDGADGNGWAVGGFSPKEVIEDGSGAIAPFLGKVAVALSGVDRVDSLRTEVHLPRLLSSALIVYRVTPSFLSITHCPDPHLQPLLVHTSQVAEAQFYPLVHRADSRPILLHTHSSGPYVPPLDHSSNRGVRMSIYSSVSAPCSARIESIEVRVDWWGTLGRWAGRFFSSVAVWGVAVTSLVVYGAWREGDTGGSVPSVQQALRGFVSRSLPRLLLASTVVSLVPLPEHYYLGNGGEALFAPIAPLLLLVSSGLVCVSWWILSILMWPLGKLVKVVFKSSRERDSVREGVIVSMCLIFMLIFLVVPWQVAFLGCWLVHLHTCSASVPGPASTGTRPCTPTQDATIPILRRNGGSVETDFRQPQEPSRHCTMDHHNHKMLTLLLMTWLLPFAAPVLVVWVRTLATAGLTAVFDGDHNFLNVAFFLVLVDFASWTSGPLFERSRFEGWVTAPSGLVGVAATACLVGPRTPYRVFEAADVAMACMVIVRIGPRYLGRNSWPRRPRK